MAMGKGNHSTSQMKPGLTSWKPQGTRRPTLTHIGGVVLFSDGTRDVGRSTKAHEASSTSFNKGVKR